MPGGSIGSTGAGVEIGQSGIPDLAALGLNNRYNRLSQLASGLVTFNDPHDVFDENISNGAVGGAGLWTRNILNTGTVTRGQRGCTLCSSNAGANSVGSIIFGSNMDAGGLPLLFPNGSTSKFIFFMLTRLTTAIDNVSEIGAGDSVEWLIGCRGASSTAKFVARFSNGPTLLTSGVSIDTNFHLFACWRDGTTTFFSVNNPLSFRVTDEVPAQSSAAFSTNQERLFLRAANNGTAANRAFETQYTFLRTEAVT